MVFLFSFKWDFDIFGPFYSCPLKTLLVLGNILRFNS